MGDSDLMQLARERAEEIINMAQGELVAAAREIAARHNIPDGIQGLTAGEFLGRLSFVTSMSRDLRVVGCDYLSRDCMRVVPVENPPAVSETTPERAAPNDAADLSVLCLHPNQLKALKGAGIHQVVDLDRCTDDMLLGIRGIAPPSLAKIREAQAQFKARGA